MFCFCFYLIVVIVVFFFPSRFIITLGEAFGAVQNIKFLFCIDSGGGGGGSAAGA